MRLLPLLPIVLNSKAKPFPLRRRLFDMCWFCAAGGQLKNEVLIIEKTKKSIDKSFFV